MQRVDIQECQPAALKAMFGLEQYLEATDLLVQLIELIKIRASQINGCAFCIQMHSKAALENGESVERERFLTIMCGADNPVADFWTPLPTTCEGYAQSDEVADEEAGE